MKAIKFPECNAVLGKGQEEYTDLPALLEKDGTMVCCFELSEDDIQEIVKNKCIWLSQLTFNRLMQPILLTTKKSDLINE